MDIVKAAIMVNNIIIITKAIIVDFIDSMENNIINALN